MNPEQVQAIEHQDGPCALLAQAGCHRAGTEILMADGSIESVEDVQVGDFLMGPNGVERKVLGLCRGEGQMYRVVPVKGEPFVVNEDHVLTLVETSTDAVTDVKVSDWLEWSEYSRKNHKLFRVGVTRFSGTWDRRWPVDPYLLGVLLGDGSIVRSVGVTTVDPELQRYVRHIAEVYGLAVRQDGDGGSTTTWTLTARNGEGQGPGRNPIVNGLKELGLYGCKSGTKFVPDCYLRAPVETRLEVLAGLMDTDGSLSGGGFDYITKSPRLAAGVFFLARSCGFAAYVTECWKQDQHGTGGMYQRISISGDMSTLPTIVARKKAAPRQQKKDVLRTGVTLERLGVEKFYGFTLDFDGRYVMGDFTVTHNSGKTRALVHRIARMVEQGTPARRILAVTFSKKAADEMNERLDKLGIDDARVGTWHSLCLQILREDETAWAEWDRSDEAQAKVGGLLKEALGFKHLNWREADAGAVERYIGWCKAHLADPMSEVAQELAEEKFETAREAELAMRAYDVYQRLVEEKNILTYDDFLVFAHRHLVKDEEARLKWASRWTQMLVDEAQDNNPAQKAMQHLLAKEHRNLMLVGDVAQSIYGFRGSNPAFLAGFAAEWGGTTVIMNRNYRSGRAIVNVANKIIASAAVRLPTDMLAERDHEGTARALGHTDQDAEGEAFAQWVLEMSTDHQPLSSMCALFRTNAQSRALEEACLKHRIPYVVVGGTSFYERREVKNLLAYLRVATGRDKDGDAVKRCINTPFRFLGTAFVERMMDAAAGKKVSNWPALARKVAEQAGIQTRQRASVQEWANLLERVGANIAAGEAAFQAETAPVPEARPAAILNELVERTGYLKYLEREQGVESVENSHAANVREMVRIAERFDTVKDLLDYIEAMAKAAKKQRADGQAGGERVLLMSVHRSKGLEWANVWVNGCNEMVLPHVRGDIEEERRLMYVAATRARDNLVLSYVRQFARPEGIKEAQPSRFLRDAGLVA
jgi:superfamily I DNA/RNA helicase